MRYGFALHVTYNELRRIQTLQELNRIFLMRESMVQFAFKNGCIAGVSTDKISKNTVSRRSAESLYLALFLYDQTNRYRLHTTCRKTGCHFLPEDRRQLKSNDTIQHTTCLLCIHQIIVDITRVGDSVQYITLRDRRENDTVRFLVLQT